MVFATSLPPGVRMARMRDDLVLYEWRPGRVTLLSVILNKYYKKDLKLLNRENEKEWLALYQLWESVITGMSSEKHACSY